MNRKERRAALKRGVSAGNAAQPKDAAFDAAELLAKANWLREQGQSEQALDLCNRVLARMPRHVDALNSAGLILQASGRHQQAVKMLAKAIAADGFNAACHYNIAGSYQVLQRRDEAIVHFKRAIALGMSVKNVEDVVLQNPVITACVERIETAWPLAVRSEEIFPDATVTTIADDILLQCALQLVVLRGVALERFLTILRPRLLSFSREKMMGDVLGLFAAVAQQCFINEYVFEQSDTETRHATELA